MKNFESEKLYRYLITKKTRKSGEEMVKNVYKSKNKKHLLIENAEDFSSEKEDERLNSFTEFLKSKNFCEEALLKGESELF